MNAEARNPAGGVWASLEGHIVNGAFPLHRLLGSSDHSGVFQTESAKRAPAELAIKLVPVIAAPTGVQLSRWLAAADLDHAHLLRVIEAGKCEVDGLHYLYAVMEYADQTLAQLLQSRALTEDEAREMLAPMLSALAFLHEKKFVQGHLKPSNVLVVGDQLKVAGDTSRLVDDVGDGVGTLSVYHPPEGRDGRCSAKGDIWALGVTLCEALTRRQPSGLRGGGEAELPPDLGPAFHEFVARCLSRSPQDRPEVAELEAWLRGRPLPAVAVPIPESAAMALLESGVAPPLTGPAASVPAVEADMGAWKRRALALMLAAFAAFVLVWAGLRAIRPAPSVPAPPSPVAAASLEPPAVAAADPEPADAPAIDEDVAPLRAEAEGAGSSLSAIQQVMPIVPRSASQTITGTIRVSVRVIIDRDGTVFAALTEHPSRSRYFERLAIEAAQQWTFTPSQTETQRIALIRFAFRRDGTTGSAVPP